MSEAPRQHPSPSVDCRTDDVTLVRTPFRFRPGTARRGADAAPTPPPDPPAVPAPPDDERFEDAVTLFRPEPTRVVPFVARPTRVAGYDILSELGRGSM